MFRRESRASLSLQGPRPRFFSHWLLLGLLLSTASGIPFAQSGKHNLVESPRDTAPPAESTPLPAGGGAPPAGNPMAVERIPYSPAMLHKQEMSLQAAQILAVATTLRQEVYRSNAGMLSVSVVRNAQTIEKLARGVKDEIKHAPGSAHP